MKTTLLFKTICFGALLSSMAACDILDIDPLDTYTQEEVFSDVQLLKSYVHRNYTLPTNGLDEIALRFSCDESKNNFNWNSCDMVIEGTITPDNLGNLDIWQAYYENIKNSNVFFEHIDQVKKVDQPEQNYLIGEETFFRAYFYMELVNRFGGVPLITTSYNLGNATETLKIKRNSYQECVTQIAQWFKEAADLLPEKYDRDEDFGRVTKVAALAMRSRMLLYAASPLAKENLGSTVTYADADIATKEVIDLCKALGYDLDPDYKGLFLNPESKEIIFERLYNQEFGHWFDWKNSPNGWNGYSATCVTQEMVDSYEMAGRQFADKQWYGTKEFTWAEGNKADWNPWLNRDPRFYASIVCNGQPFRDRPAEFYVDIVKNKDGNYTDNEGNFIVTTGGKDSEKGIDNWNYSETHYTIRKFMDESLRKSWSDKGKQPWIYCRLAEVYLNYAETRYFCNDEKTARFYLNEVRKRARNYGRDYLGQNIPNMLPDVTDGGEELFKAIQQERKVELAFEEHRFYDVRRWKNAQDNQTGKFHGIVVARKNLKEGVEGAEPEYVIGYKIMQVGNERKFEAPTHYLVPIPNYERRKNAELTQNPGYSDL